MLPNYMSSNAVKTGGKGSSTNNTASYVQADYKWTQDNRKSKYLLCPTNERRSASSKFFAVFLNRKGQMPSVIKEKVNFRNSHLRGIHSSKMNESSEKYRFW